MKARRRGIRTVYTDEEENEKAMNIAFVIMIIVVILLGIFIGNEVGNYIDKITQ